MTNVDYILKTCQFVCKIVDTKHKLLRNTHVVSGNGQVRLNTSEHQNVPTVWLNWGRNVVCVFRIIKQPAYIYKINKMRYNRIHKALRDLDSSAY
jgi:hypothetical protein